MATTETHGTAARYCVKRHTYRGQNGWLVYTVRHKCNRPLCFARIGERIFCHTEAEARRMAGELKRGLTPLFDYQLASVNRSVLESVGYVFEKPTR